MRTLWQVFQHKPIVRSDAHLLSAFVHDKSEEAFTDLVHRHGGMVLGVCQRILGHSQDAEDAFQAAFLVLAQKAPSLHGDSPLGPWLYGVARRVAMKARSRRQALLPLTDSEQPDAHEETTSMATSMEWSELRPIIDEEIAHLPGHYQTVLILCQLDGLTKIEAAKQLGCPEGTISSRLMRAREMLRTRLTKRGIALTSLTLLDALLASSPVSAQLTQNTLGLAMKVALGISLSAGVSTSVLTLAQGATQAMFITKVKMVAAGLVLVTGLSLGTSYVAGGWGQDKQSNSGKQPTSAVKPKDAPKSSEIALESKSTAKSMESASALIELGKVDSNLAVVFNDEMTLDDRLAYLESQTGLACIIDSEAFREGFSDFDQKLLREQKTKLPRMTNQTTSTLIHAMLDNLQYQQQPVPSTFLVRRGTLVIVPKAYVTNAASKIQVAFDARPQEVDLILALERLSQDTGVSIILDPRAKPNASDCKVNINFRNLKLINAVKLLANMAELTVINIDGALYVSTSENCKKMEDEIQRDTGRGAQ